jgi:hypothetical protein
MRYDESNRTFDCEPTLTDSQVLQFCKDGFLLLEGVVPNDTNERSCEWLDGKRQANPTFVPEGMEQADLDRIRATHEPSTIMLEDWFIRDVLLNEQLGGALRSLLGRNVGLPVLVSYHPTECPGDAQGWHYDADHVIGPEVNYLEVFYFPQETPVELGPTEVIAGSHLRPISADGSQAGLPLAGPAGTLGIHMQSIIHRKGPSTATGVRRMLKYNYWRTSAPQRDWKVEPDFDFEQAQYGGHGVARYVAHMMYWLCGRGDEFRIVGGQAWPWRSANQIGTSYGYDASSGYLPNWRRPTHDDYAS